MAIDYPNSVDIQELNDEIWFDIINRSIVLKDGYSQTDMLVQNDANSRNLGFMIQRYFEGEDLSTKRIRIHYVNSLNQHDVASAHSIEVVGESEDVISFQWLVSDKVCAEGGNVQFAIEFYNDSEKYRWFTKPTSIGIEKGICTVGEFIEPESDWFREYSARMNILEANMKSFNQAVENGEFDGAYTLNTFANAVKGNASGKTVRIDDTSTVEHTMDVKVQSKNLANCNSILRTTHAIATYTEPQLVITKTSTSGGWSNIYIEIGDYKDFVGKTLTVSLESLNEYSWNILFAGLNNQNNLVDDIALGSTVLGTNKMTKTIPAMGDAQKLALRILSTDSTSSTDVYTLQNIQVEIGNTATEYTPYVDPTTVTLTRGGKNLFNGGDITVTDIYTRVTLDCVLRAGITYTLKADVVSTDTDDSRCQIYDPVNSIRFGYIGRGKGQTLTFTPTNDTNMMQFYTGAIYQESEGDTATFSRIQLEIGDTATEYESFKIIDTYTPNADGVVSGVTSLYPTTTLLTDNENVIIECEYNKDTNKALESFITSDGTVISQNADFAEVAEWADGNPDNEDRTGYFVCANVPLDGIVMKKATSTDDVKGVTIANPAFAGNYSKDKLDSNGNLLPKYSYVAIIGFVPVIDNGTCTVGGRCMPDDNGCAIPSSNNMGYQVVNRIDENRVLIIIEPNGDMVQRIKDKVTKLQEIINNLVVDENGVAIGANVETKTNKVTVVDVNSTHEQYPTAEAVYNSLSNIDGSQLKSGSVSIGKLVPFMFSNNVHMKDTEDILFEKQTHQHSVTHTPHLQKALEINDTDERVVSAKMVYDYIEDFKSTLPEDTGGISSDVVTESRLAEFKDKEIEWSRAYKYNTTDFPSNIHSLTIDKALYNDMYALVVTSSLAIARYTKADGLKYLVETPLKVEVKEGMSGYTNFNIPNLHNIYDAGIVVEGEIFPFSYLAEVWLDEETYTEGFVEISTVGSTSRPDGTGYANASAIIYILSPSEEAIDVILSEFEPIFEAYGDTIVHFYRNTPEVEDVEAHSIGG